AVKSETQMLIADASSPTIPAYHPPDLAAKPLPATTQPAAPLPTGGSFSGDSNHPNTYDENTSKDEEKSTRHTRRCVLRV
ncbi:hypothetical protein, partial [uncultured Mucilaginibacter sp.]|uniref:hypothetical protein n=1 Tax=uncultured Mucilaginibacter sp. TaxID=797541 RepID=UPI0025E42F86